MKFIAYVDVIGTSESTKEPKEYKRRINSFISTLTNYADFLGKNSAIHYFSDCAYIQTDELYSMILFLTQLRQSLIPDGIFFTAAVKRGELHPNTQKDSGSISRCQVQGVSFTGEAIAELYKFQSSFKGIGIRIDDNLVEELKKTEYGDKLIESFFIKEISSDKTNNDSSLHSEIIKFLDIAFDIENIRSMEFSIINKILDAALFAGSQNPKYGRNYVSIIITFMKSYMKNNQHLTFDWNNEKLISAPALWSVIYNLSIDPNKPSELFGLDYFCLILLDILYTERANQRLSDVNRRKLADKLLRTGIIKEKYENVSQIPEILFSASHWRKILQDYQSTATTKILEILSEDS